MAGLLFLVPFLSMCSLTVLSILSVSLQNH